MEFCSFFSWIYWDPHPDIFVIPYLNHPLKWYGFLFVTGLFSGFFLLVPLVRQRLSQTKTYQNYDKIKLNEISYSYVDQLVWFIVIGTVVGARLGHVFFYEWPRYQNHLIDIFKVWEGGLASHGGTIGVLTAVFFYVQWTKKKFPEITFIGLCDLLTIPTAFAVCFIRLGNFVNQEIVGTPTRLPWAVIFGHPADGSAPIPRHPVQLYEAAAYLLTFLILKILWNKRDGKFAPGFLIGLFFILVFGSRFLIEFFKAPQSHMLDESLLQTGQLLSIPFILAGFLLVMQSLKKPIDSLNKT